MTRVNCRFAVRVAQRCIFAADGRGGHPSQVRRTVTCPGAGSTPCQLEPGLGTRTRVGDNNTDKATGPHDPRKVSHYPRQE